MPGGDGQLGGYIDGFQPVLRHAELIDRVELAALPGQFEGQVHRVDRLHDRAGVALDQPGGAFFEHAPAGLIRQRLDAHFAVQDIENIVVVKDMLAASGQAQAGSADDDRTGKRDTTVHESSLGGGWLRPCVG